MINIELYKKMKKKYNFDESNYEENKHIRAPKGAKDKDGNSIGGRWVSKNDIANLKELDSEVSEPNDEDENSISDDFNSEKNQESKNDFNSQSKDKIENNLESDNNITKSIKSFEPEKKSQEQIMSEFHSSKNTSSLSTSLNEAKKSGISISEDDIREKMNGIISNISGINRDDYTELMNVINLSKQEGIALSEELLMDRFYDFCDGRGMDNLERLVELSKATGIEIDDYTMSKKTKEIFDGIQNIFSQKGRTSVDTAATSLCSFMDFASKNKIKYDQNTLINMIKEITESEKCSALSLIDIMKSAKKLNFQFKKSFLSKKLTSKLMPTMINNKKQKVLKLGSTYEAIENMRNVLLIAKKNDIELGDEATQTAISSLSLYVTTGTDLYNLKSVADEFGIEINKDDFEYMIDDCFSACDNSRDLRSLIQLSEKSGLNKTKQDFQRAAEQIFKKLEETKTNLIIEDNGLDYDEDVSDYISNLCMLEQINKKYGLELDGEYFSNLKRELLENMKQNYSKQTCNVDGEYKHEMSDDIYELASKLINGEDVDTSIPHRINSFGDQKAIMLALGQDFNVHEENYLHQNTYYMNSFLFNQTSSWNDNAESFCCGETITYEYSPSRDFYAIDNGDAINKIEKSVDTLDKEMRASPFRFSTYREISPGELGFAIGMDSDLIDAIVDRLQTSNGDTEKLLNILKSGNTSWNNVSIQSTAWVDSDVQDMTSVFQRKIRFDYDVQEGTDVYFTGNDAEREIVLGRGCQCQLDTNNIYWDEKQQQLVLGVKVYRGERQPIEDIANIHRENQNEKKPISSTTSESLESRKKRANELLDKMLSTDSADSDIKIILNKYKKIKYKYYILKQLKVLKQKYNK